MADLWWHIGSAIRALGEGENIEMRFLHSHQETQEVAMRRLRSCFILQATCTTCVPMGLHRAPLPRPWAERR
eukprot:214673-Pyramimonas_sp.AAC.1